MWIRKGVSVLVLAGLHSGLIGTQVSAAEGDGLDEVIVTASKRSERLSMFHLRCSSSTQRRSRIWVFETSMTTQVWSRTSPSEASAPRFRTVVIRGLNTGPQQTTSTVGFYLDDTPFTAAGSRSVASLILPDADLGDVAGIEVLKGPQGTLYGATSLGGLVRILSNKPDLTQFGRYGDRLRHDGAERGIGLRIACHAERTVR
ncbi:MAG: TonB-dependent receptor plug domain-containing protein [Steroidobacteraceae bacterium]